ncbi:hypothetical protein A3860_33665 [Niastella vici]|uniref:Glycoside hydrolase 123-like N-terminal domain-containing protein n=1 Tax=Niastella vici TaxID=1703345 RepID=A0A1V9FQ61_9BACT|nr:glycoside hydrolase domain-containing protein [Niastella vici]OQP60470.1 hypothetical protein A3860_33665 [Niastella vici]
MKKLFVPAMLSALLMLLQSDGELSAQTNMYGTGQWDRCEFGNHRVVIEVNDDAPAAQVHIPWRRLDDPGNKSVILVDASTGRSIHNFHFRAINKEFADLIFEPATGKGKYYLYYLPYKNTGSWYFPNTVYPAAEKITDPQWNLKYEGKELSQAHVVRFESVTEFDSFDPMETVATASEVEELLLVNKNKGFLLFPEDRKHPIRMDSDIPLRWVQRKDGEPFNAIVMRNEFFAFQLGIYTPFRELRNVQLAFTDLLSTQGATISKSVIRCFNLAGINWLGKPFTKAVHIQKGKVQPLWIGVDLPSDTRPGAYEGEITVQAEGVDRKVKIRLEVQDSLLTDRGYGELFRMARLNWLDSKIGLDDSIYKPYTPIQLQGNTIRILGRELRFDRYGLPDKITSDFSGSNDRVGAPARDILSGPMRLLVFRNDKELIWKGGKPVITLKTAGAVSWKTQLRNGRSLLEIDAKMECDGYIDYQVTLSAGEDLALDDIQLQIPYAHEAATYMMGLGRKGGKRPEHWEWKWDKQMANNMLWLGDMNAGLQCKLKHESPDWSLYNFSKTGTYKDWSNEGLGGCTLHDEGQDKGRVLFKAFTGRKMLRKGQTIHLNFGLLITPVKPLDNSHWNERYFQADPPMDNWRKEAMKKGATVMNVHQGNLLNPYINYPFITTDTLKRYINTNRRSGIRTKIYYTVRELSNYAPEIWAFRSLGDEIFTPGLGAQLADQFADDGLGGNLYAKGGSWLVEHLRTRYDAAWHTPLEGGEYDMSIRTQGLSRLHNYYLEGLAWLVRNTGMRGIYLDGVGYDREIMKRVRKVLDRSADSCLIDFHSGNNFSASYGMNSPANQYMELFPCINSLWLGEGYNYNEGPDYWLTEMAGLPFGLYGEMLNGCGNPYRGMLYGMTSRLGWVGCDPSSVWKLWDEFGIQQSRMIGYWDPNIPVKCNQDDVKVTVYQKEDKLLIVYASWAKEDLHIGLSLNWNALKMAPAAVSVYAPGVNSLQEKQTSLNLDDLPVPAGKGGFIIISKKQ